MIIQENKTIQKVYLIPLPNENGADELQCPFCLKRCDVQGYASFEHWYPGHALIHDSNCPLLLSFNFPDNSPSESKTPFTDAHTHDDWSGGFPAVNVDAAKNLEITLQNVKEQLKFIRNSDNYFDPDFNPINYANNAWYLIENTLSIKT